MSHHSTDTLANGQAISIDSCPPAQAVTPRRVSKEQLAAAERARQYHVNKLAAYRARAQASESLPAPTPDPHAQDGHGARFA